MADTGNLLGKNIKKLRESRKETQPQLAKVLNVTSNTISNYETGIRLPDIEKLQLIARHYGITLDEMVRTSVEPIEDEEGSPLLRDILPLGELLFPLFDVDTQKDSEFRRAYDIAKSLVDQTKVLEITSGDFFFSKWEMAIQGFNACLDGEHQMAAVANIVTMMLLALAAIPDELSKVIIAQHQRKPFTARSNIRDMLRDILDNVDNYKSSDRTKLAATIDEDLFYYLRILNDDPNWSAVAQYHIANLYYANLYDSERGRLSNYSTGLEMHLNQLKLGNEYSLHLIEFILGI